MAKPLNRRDLFARTAAVGAALALPLTHGAVALQAQSRPDAALEAAWQRIVAAADALDVIGGNNETEAEHELYATMDEAENFIQSTTAQTPHGAAIQLWLALRHTTDSIAHDEIVKRRDLDAISGDRGLDWDAKCIVAALRSLEATTP